ncbi:MAG: cytochrome c [Myxococcota bacterium]
MNARPLLLPLTLLALALSACDEDATDTGAPTEEPQEEDDDVDDDVDDDDDEPEAVSYADVAPILSQYCTGCHQTGGPGGFSLESYEDASSRSGRLVARAVDGTGGPMPPSGLALTPEEEDILIAWDAAGAPETASR